MASHLYLINPRTDYLNHFNMDVFEDFGLRPAMNVADAATSTVAAMASDDFYVTICDEHASPVDYDTDADFIGITGKVSQWKRMKAIASEFRKRGKTVLMGGSYATLSPDVVRPHCDILVRGEIEEISQKLFADLRERRWKDEYLGGRPDLSMSPIPKWSLYLNERAVYGAVQTARGCPFECEYCDVIEYVGRKTRIKSVAQVLAELDEVYRHGYRQVYLCDDNFTAYRNRCKELLVAMRHWNDRQEQGDVQFLTQLSIDAARDDEVVTLCADAGLSSCFIGIETPNEESLKETKKRQNLRGDMLEQVQRFVDEGIMPLAGMMIGFDHDGPDIFQRQYDFAMASPIPIFSIAILVAPDSTPLYARLAKEGRIVEDGEQIAAGGSGGLAGTNIVPKMMTREQLAEGFRWLSRELYRPAAFGERLVRFIETAGRRRTATKTNKSTWRSPRSIEIEAINLVSHQLRACGPEEALLWERVSKALRKNRTAARAVWQALFTFMQYRYVLRERGWLVDADVEREANDSFPLAELALQ